MASSPNTYRTVNVISKEDFDKMTPPATRANNPEVPPLPPGMSADAMAYDEEEEVFVMEDDAKTPSRTTTSDTLPKQVSWMR